MGQISLIRHGQASFGKANYDQLSELGYRQGEVLGEWLKNSGRRIDRIVTGSMERHRQTAEAAARSLGDLGPPREHWQEHPGLNEYDHVEMLLRHEPRFQEPEFLRALFQDNPNPRQAFQALFVEAFARWMSNEFPQDYAESWPQFQQRCLAAIQDLSQASDKRSEHILVFTSGGPISAICQQLLEVPDSRMAELNSSIVNASLTKLLFQPKRISLSVLNGHAHFEQHPDARTLITYR